MKRKFGMSGKRGSRQQKKGIGAGNSRKRTASLESIIDKVVRLERGELEKRIKDFKGRFKLDFTDEYLKGCSVERLRHILFAALINAGKPK